MGINQDDGSDYKPTTLRGHLSSFDRHLRHHGYQHSINDDVIFSRVRDVLKSKQVVLKRSGKGNTSNRAEALTDTDVKSPFKSDQLSNDKPEWLLRLVWFLNAVHFGLRGVSEHHSMRWGGCANTNVCTDSEGNEYVEYNERNTKNEDRSRPP